MIRNQRGGIIFKLLGLLCFVALLAVLYLLRNPLLRMAGSFWVVEDPPAQADVIIVIGDDTYAGDRAFRAADLYRAGRAPVVVASGRKLRSYSFIAEMMVHDLLADGVEGAAIQRFDHTATNTLDEAMALRPLIAEKGWKSVLLVTSNYHTRRARLIFRSVLPAQVSLGVAAARDPGYDPASWWKTRAGLKIFFLESVGYAVARWELRNISPQEQSN